MKLSPKEVLILHKALALSRDKLLKDKKFSRVQVWDLHARLFDEALKQREEIQPKQ